MVLCDEKACHIKLSELLLLIDKATEQFLKKQE